MNWQHIAGTEKKTQSKPKTIFSFIAGGAVIVTRPENQTAEENSSVTFDCEGQANPANLTVKWYHGGIDVRKQANFEGRLDFNRETGSLTLNTIRGSDQGRFTCQVTNGIGRPIEASAYLAVVCKLTK